MTFVCANMEYAALTGVSGAFLLVAGAQHLIYGHTVSKQERRRVKDMEEHKAKEATLQELLTQEKEEGEETIRQIQAIARHEGEQLEAQMRLMQENARREREENKAKMIHVNQQVLREREKLEAEKRREIAEKETALQWAREEKERLLEQAQREREELETAQRQEIAEKESALQRAREEKEKLEAHAQRERCIGEMAGTIKSVLKQKEILRAEDVGEILGMFEEFGWGLDEANRHLMAACGISLPDLCYHGAETPRKRHKMFALGSSSMPAEEPALKSGAGNVIADPPVMVCGDLETSSRDQQGNPLKRRKVIDDDIIDHSRPSLIAPAAEPEFVVHTTATTEPHIKKELAEAEEIEEDLQGESRQEEMVENNGAASGSEEDEEMPEESDQANE